MANELHNLETSIKEFLENSQSDSYNSRGISSHKYNNLKISMDYNQEKTPHIVLRIGISEAMYNINNGERMSGGLGSDERYIRRWLDKPSIKAELQTAWGHSKKIKTVSVKEDEDEY